MPDAKTSVTQAWVQFALATSYNDLPAEVVVQAKEYILDHIGCIISGVNSPVGKACIAMALEEGGSPDATILGTGIKTSRHIASFVNAKMGNTHDNDEVFLNRMHIGTIPVSAALAAGERARCSGKDIILATVLGYDISARCALSTPIVVVTPEKEVKYPSVLGYSYASFGAATSVAKVLRLNDEQFTNALWLTAYLSPAPLATLWRDSSPANPAKYTDMGYLTQAGVTGAILAQKGCGGDASVLDSADFWAACGVSRFDYGSFLNGLGEKWYIMESSMKPYPCCRHFHAAMDMYTRIARENRLSPDDIEAIKIKVPPTVLRPNYVWAKVARWDIVEPRDYISSEFSFAYNMACAAYGITPGPQWHTPETMNDPRLLEFGKKVVLEGNPESIETAESLLAYKGAPGAIRRKFPVSIEVRAKGKAFVDKADYARGDSWVPGYRMTHDEIRQKFAANVSGIVKKSNIEKAISQLEKLEDIADIREITKLLAGEDIPASRGRTK